LANRLNAVKFSYAASYVAFERVCGSETDAQNGTRD